MGRNNSGCNTAGEEPLAEAMRLHRGGELRRAEALYERALEADPDHVEALHLLGVVTFQRGDGAAAVDLIGKAVALDPNHAKAHANLGVALARLGKLDDAAAAYRTAIALAPNHAEAHFNLAVALARLDKFDEAIAGYREAVAVKPDYAEAHNNLGAVLRDRGKLDEAVASCRRAVACDPDLAGAYYNLGLALKDHGELVQAIAAYGEAIALQPDYAEAHANLGVALRIHGDLNGAIAAYDRALAIDPAHADARFGRSLVRLLRGDFVEGWRDYLARESTRRNSRGFHRDPLANKLAGTRALVIKDQGLGDEVLFLRFAPRLKDRGAHITYRAGRKIATLVERLSFIDRLAGPEDKHEAFDLVLTVGDLPYLLGMTDVRDIPPSIELSVLPERLAGIRTRLAEFGPPPYIGVTWRAGTREPIRRLRLAPLDRLAAVLRPARATFVAVQRNPAEGEIDAFAGMLGRPVHDLTALNDDLEGMLAVVDLLDDYVCVSNLNIELRAARGRPCRVLVPIPAGFRWMAEGDESPWFRGSRVYRQTPGGGWDAAFEDLAGDLAAAWPGG